MGLPHLLAPNLLTEGKRADLVICGNVVLNTIEVEEPNSRAKREPIEVEE